MVTAKCVSVQRNEFLEINSQMSPNINILLLLLVETGGEEVHFVFGGLTRVQ